MDKGHARARHGPYSISVNAEEARVLQSEPGLGTSLTVATDTESLAEKADQSTFPPFRAGAFRFVGDAQPQEHRAHGRGIRLGAPRRPLRVSRHPGGGGSDAVPTGPRLALPGRARFGGDGTGIPLVKRLALAAGPDDLADRCGPWGRSPSARPDAFSTGAIAALDPLTERLAAESFRGRPIAHPERRRNSKNARSCVWLPRTSMR